MQTWRGAQPVIIVKIGSVRFPHRTLKGAAYSTHRHSGAAGIQRGWVTSIAPLSTGMTALGVAYFHNNGCLVTAPFRVRHGDLSGLFGPRYEDENGTTSIAGKRESTTPPNSGLRRNDDS